jgi:hypothetical protein
MFAPGKSFEPPGCVGHKGAADLDEIPDPIRQCLFRLDRFYQTTERRNRDFALGCGA